MTQKSGDCYIDIWRDKEFRGESMRIYGPAEYPSLDFTQGNWCDDIGSLRVGPNAFVMAYHRRDFKEELVTFGPNDEVADLGQFKFDDEIESMKVIDSLKIFNHLEYNAALAPCVTPAAETAGDRRPQHHLNKGRRGRGRRR